MAKRTDRERGMEFQRWVKRWLEQRGWDVVNVPPRGIMIQDKRTKARKFVSLRNDIFGCDLVARKVWTLEKDGHDHFKEIWIQATMGYRPGKKLEQVSAHPVPRIYPGTNVQIETQIWMKVESTQINIKRVTVEEGTTALEDLGKIMRGTFYATEGITYDF